MSELLAENIVFNSPRQAQHHAFTEKRDLLIANTNLRLNIPLIPMAAWDEAGISTRCQQLTDTALRLWPGPRH